MVTVPRAMTEQEERRGLSPFAWRFGWLGAALALVPYVAGIAVLLAYDRGLALPIGPVGAALGLLVALLALAYFWPARISVDEDGLVYRRYGWPTFVPYSKILRVESQERAGTAMKVPARDHARWPAGWNTQAIRTVFCGLRLHLDGGGVLDIGTTVEEVSALRIAKPRPGALGHYGAADRAGMELRRAIEAGCLTARLEPRSVGPLETTLRRGDRTAIEWLAAARRAATSRADDYRGAAGPIEALWRVLEEARVPRDARAAAAFALRPRLDEDGRHRMRVVAENCLSPRLRVAIDAVLSQGAEEDAALLLALEEASAPNPLARRSPR